MFTHSVSASRSSLGVDAEAMLTAMRLVTIGGLPLRSIVFGGRTMRPR